LAGLAAAVLVSNSPSLLGHAALATVDFGVVAALLAASYLVFRWAREPNGKRGLAAALGCAVALTCKFSAVVWVFSFKQPSAEELDHNFLWRSWCKLPERGRIGIFNRSYFEEALVVRVHPELIDKQRLPVKTDGMAFWEERFEDINAFEKHISRNGTLIVKFFLNLSKDEQRRRFIKRLTDPDKLWKFSMGDIEERAHWDDYRQAYQDLIANTSTPWAPWYVIPADNKWLMRALVIDVITDAISSLDIAFPKIPQERMKEFRQALKMLRAQDRASEGPGGKQPPAA
jgi:PPK2 family polyphosphate:nucleotide phosphotransferase